MNFAPSLRRLLDLRRSLERQEEMKMAVASGRLHAIEAEQERGRTSARREQAALLDELQNEATGADLQAASLRRGIEEQRAARLAEQAQHAAAAQAEQRERLLERTRERETLDTLAEQARQQRQQERQRQEQAALDEAFLLRHASPREPPD